MNRRKTIWSKALTNMNPQVRYEIGMVGLGVMGRNLLLNTADYGFSVAGYDKDFSKVDARRKESAERDICGAENINDFIGLLRPSRAVMMLVPAGAPVDSAIKDLLPHMDKDDLIIDAGNSYFKDTNLRARNLTGKGIQFLGLGVSGGEEGARHGPSIMPGGPDLLLDAEIWRKIMANEEDLRGIVCKPAGLGVPAPGLMTALGYLDGYLSAWSLENLIQAQRDYFRAHTYERIDAKATFHAEWEEN